MVRHGGWSYGRAQNTKNTSLPILSQMCKSNSVVTITSGPRALPGWRRHDCRWWWQSGLARASLEIIDISPPVIRVLKHKNQLYMKVEGRQVRSGCTALDCVPRCACHPVNQTIQSADNSSKRTTRSAGYPKVRVYRSQRTTARVHTQSMHILKEND